MVHSVAALFQGQWARALAEPMQKPSGTWKIANYLAHRYIHRHNGCYVPTDITSVRFIDGLQKIGFKSFSDCTLNNCTGTACVEINKKLACTLPKSKNRVAAKCTSVASALVATRFCTSVMLYKRWLFISSTRSRAVMSVTPLCRWTCALVQVIERRALAYIRVASKEFILSILGCVCVFQLPLLGNASSCLLSMKKYF